MAASTCVRPLFARCRGARLNRAATTTHADSLMSRSSSSTTDGAGNNRITDSLASRSSSSAADGAGNNRTFVSKAFKLEDEWNRRLQSTSMQPFQKVEMNKFFFEIERKLDREKRGSAVDLDIFANNVRSSSSEASETVEQLEELLHRFRRTPQTCETMASTPHAVVRAFLDVGMTDNLLRILDDRLNYGLFPDDYSLVLMLDTFLEANNWRDGAKVGAHMMLQEEFRVPVAAEMAVLATYKYVMCDAAASSSESSCEWDPQPPQPPPDEPEEEVKVWVGWMEPDYNDEHFDLREPRHICGKTLANFSAHNPVLSSAAANASVELLGWTLFEKWERAHDVVRRQPHLCRRCVDKCLSVCGGNSAATELHSALTRASLSDDVGVEAALAQRVVDSVAANEEQYVRAQSANFSRWDDLRSGELRRQQRLYAAESRKEQVKQKKLKLKENEELLFFFDRFDQMEMEKEEKVRAWRRTFPAFWNAKKRWGPVIRLKPKEEAPGPFGWGRNAKKLTKMAAEAAANKQTVHSYKDLTRK